MTGASAADVRVASAPGGSRGTLIAFGMAAMACTVAFTWMLTFGTGRLVADDSFGNFYDYQAQAWLHGRWDVPEPALGGEAFVVHGKVYGYFGPTPALMRLPLVMAGIGFGKVTRLFMLLDYLGCLLATWMILRHAARTMTGKPAPPWIVIIVMLSAGLGSTLFFLGSRAYVYHEAILCGAAFALWSVWCALRYVATPSRRWGVAALVCGVLSVHARPPLGLFALTFVAAVGLEHAWRRRRFTPVWIAVAAGAGVLSFNAVSYIKFGTWEGCPLRYNVQYTPERLATIGSSNFQLGNLRFNADSYLFVPSASVQRNFPYIYLEYLDRKKYPSSHMAYRDPTLAIPYAMPALAFLALVGLGAAFRRRGAAGRSVALIWGSVLPLTFAMLTAVAVTQRYTADFAAFLIAAAAFGAIALAQAPRPWRAAGGAVGVALVVVSVAVQGAITLHHQRAIVWGVPPAVQLQYQLWRQHIDAFFTHSPRP